MSGSNHGHRTSAWRLVTVEIVTDFDCPGFDCPDFVGTPFIKLLFPALSYTEPLRKSGLERLDDHRDMITQSMFRQIKDPKHPLHYLLPPIKVSQ